MNCLRAENEVIVKIMELRVQNLYDEGKRWLTRKSKSKAVPTAPQEAAVMPPVPPVAATPPVTNWSTTRDYWQEY